MTCHKTLKLEDMQNMTIDQIVSLYREGYNLEDSSIEIMRENVRITQENVKIMQETPNMSITVVLLLGITSSFVGSYVYHTYYEKNVRSVNYKR